MGNAMANTRQGNLRLQEAEAASLLLVSAYLQDDEFLLNRGLVRWKTMEQRYGRNGYAFLVVTDRRLIYVNPREDEVHSIPYHSLEAHSLDSRLITGVLRLRAAGGQAAQFDGDTAFLRQAKAAIGKYGSEPDPTQRTAVAYNMDHEIWNCGSCDTWVRTVQSHCARCGRLIEWPSEP